HQDVPFTKLVQDLRPDRDLRRAPLFQVLIAFLPVMSQEIESAGVKFKVLETIEAGTARFDLTLRVISTRPELRARLEYNSDVFEHAIVQQMIGHLRGVLEQMAGD